MFNAAMFKELKRGVLFTAVTLVLFGVVYHLVLWGVGRVAFPSQAEGSLIRRGDGTIVGSRLIAQKFTRPEYFHPRPSAVDYNAASTGGSNLGPTNPDHLKAVRERLNATIALENVSAKLVPSEMVTASGAGLDPDIPPDAAEIQTARVARARNVSANRVRALVRSHTEGPAFGFLGRSRVNVLELNLALDESLGKTAAAPANTSASTR
jgi:potassium-transporting ATPase KdpC subunit